MSAPRTYRVSVPGTATMQPGTVDATYLDDALAGEDADVVAELRALAVGQSGFAYGTQQWVTRNS